MVDEYRKDYPVSVLCETLEVSLSGYFAWKKRGESASTGRPTTGKAYSGSLPLLSASLWQSAHSCGIAGARDHEFASSRKRVARLMREQSLSARRRQHKTITTKSEPGARVALNLLDQEFTAHRPNEKWTGDITAI